MKKYNLRFKHSIEKDLRKIPETMIERIFQHIESLAIEPFPHGLQKIAGAENLYRIRIGEYRVIYLLDKNNREIIIQHIRHRRDAYRDL